MTVADPVLKLDGIDRVFSGYRALADVSLEVQRGHVHSLIGPNGAGKTTLLNIVSGLLAPTSGRVWFNGRNVTGVKPHRLARRGLARTFQVTRLSSSLKCWEEVALAAQHRRRFAALRDLWRLPFRSSAAEQSLRAECDTYLQLVGLEDHAEEQSGSRLTLELQRRLEIARALALAPTICLLDEPTSGMTRVEARDIRDLIVAQAERGITVLLVAHDIQLVMDISDWITVLNGGRKIAEGPPATVARNDKVIRAYLGRKSA